MRVRIQTSGIHSRLLALFLIALLVVPPMPAQNGNLSEGPPTRLQIHILSQSPFLQPAGVLSAHSLQVRITDEWGMPVRGVTVSFRLPEVGPGGSFLNGLSSEIAITNERGEATVQGFDWREETGVTFIHVIAAYGAIRAGAMVEVHLSRKTAEPGSSMQVVPQTPIRQADSISSQDLSTAARTAEEQSNPRREVGQVATAKPVDAVALPVARSPREHTPEPPVDSREVPGFVDSRQQPTVTDELQAEPDPYIRVKNRIGGASRLWMVLLLAGAAGGAAATGMALSGSGTNGSQGGNPPVPPVTRIGTPTITISATGGN
jgi:hypothetical protein